MNVGPDDYDEWLAWIEPSVSRAIALHAATVAPPVRKEGKRGVYQSMGAGSPQAKARGKRAAEARKRKQEHGP